jgi:Sec7-like guanine-nucleotide exchange factor
LAYAVIMLNTDAHNDMVRYKMTLKEFLVNVAHNDGGELIPPYFLEDMYVIHLSTLAQHPPGT